MILGRNIRRNEVVEVASSEKINEEIEASFILSESEIEKELGVGRRK